jgi:hypothetical protein
MLQFLHGVNTPQYLYLTKHLQISAAAVTHMRTESPAETETSRRFTTPVCDYRKTTATFDILGDTWLLVLPGEYRKDTFKQAMTYTFHIITYLPSVILFPVH